MYCVKKVKEDLFWVGGTDRRLALFENAYPIPRGVSYNAYVLLDEKTVLFDTVDWAVAGQFYENLAKVLDGRPLDYIVVDHMEPDHPMPFIRKRSISPPIMGSAPSDAKATRKSF